MMENYHVRFGKGCLYSWSIIAGYKYLVHIRLELAAPGVQFLQGDHQLFNVIITAHAMIMIFFMVKNKNLCYSNSVDKYKLSFVNYSKNFHSCIVESKESEKLKKSYNSNPKKGVYHEHKKYVFLNPFNNRSKIAELAKNAMGVYIFEVLDQKDVYVGSSINLYNRVCSYLLPSILVKSDRKVLRYFKKYGFNNVKLTLCIINFTATWEHLIELEQYYIDLISPNLNVDLIAWGSNGYHTPMSQEARYILRKLRGTPIYIYDTITKTLIFLSDSKQWLYDNIGIFNIPLANCLANGNLYLNRFFFSLEIISEFPYESLITPEELKKLIFKVRESYTPKQPKSKRVLAENIIHPKLTKTFSSIGELSRHLKGDRGTIRSYINGKYKGLYRKQWKFTLISFNY